MNNFSKFFALCLTIFICACSQLQTDSTAMQNSDDKNASKNTFIQNPPIAEKIPVKTVNFGDVRVDDYMWLKDKNWLNKPEKKIVKYLEEENKYSEAFFKKTMISPEYLYKEMIDRIALEDVSVPVKHRQYYYYNKIAKDQKYPVLCRKYKSLNAKEEIILDSNKISQDKEYVRVHSGDISDDDRYLTYLVDDQGNEKYKLYIKDLREKKLLPETLMGEASWYKNGVFYIVPEQKLNKVFYHVLGTNPIDDKLIYQQDNLEGNFYLSTYLSSDEKYLFIISEVFDNSETYYIDLADKTMKPKLWLERKEKINYVVDHAHDRFYVRINDISGNYRFISTTEENKNNSQKWEEIIAANEDVSFDEFRLYQNHLAIRQTKDALPYIKFKKVSEKDYYSVEFDDEVYQASLLEMPFDSDHIRISYSSLKSPEMQIAYDLSTKKRTVLKEEEVKGYKKDNYETKRIWAKSRDGVQIPLTIVYNRETYKKGNPALIYAYGCYGIKVPPRFSSNLLSLMDRGFIYAIAHIRGGDDLGEKWHSDGKLLKRKNTFNDLIDSTLGLIEQGYAKKGNIAIQGGSAGGTLVGNVINQRPDLYKAAILQVPAVDLLNKLLDDTLPGTTAHYEELGNPQEEEYYRYIRSYSPYDNIKAQNYPAILVTGGFSDRRVPYWNGAKFVAKLRDYNKSGNVILLNTNMDAGHFGSSDRFNYLKEKARIYSFLLEVFKDQIKK